MDIQVQTACLNAEEPDNLMRAAEILRSGGTVAFPTETVYGLGADALNEAAVEKIFRAKHRPHWDPLIVHVSDDAMLGQVALVPASARLLMDAFWPGPLTLLLARQPAVPALVTAGRAWVGVRMPQHAAALRLIAAAGVPLAAPSANRFGHTSPTTAAHVLEDLDGRIDAVLDGGATQVGIESTVAGFEGADIVLYRLGAVTQKMLEAVIGRGKVRLYQTIERLQHAPESLPSPGLATRHYAPRATLVLVSVSDANLPGSIHPGSIASLDHALARAHSSGERVGVMLPDGWSPNLAPHLFPWGPWHQPEILAQRMFAGLRALDDAGATTILCPLPEGEGLAAAMRDRLARAARSK